MAAVEIYLTSWCPYCFGAKRLLSSKGVEFTEIDVDHGTGLREEMTRRAGGRYTVPQIFIDGQHVGGFDDLSALDDSGKLDQLLGFS